jgi:parvulin-like peptidyl-prolyl isomerase
MKTRIQLVAGLAVFTVTFAAKAELINGLRAVVHDSVVTVEDVRQLTMQTSDLLSRQYANDPTLLRQKQIQTDSDNLDKLMAQQLILHEFKTAGYSLPESVIDELVEERIKARFGNRMTLTKTLQAEGTTFEKFRERAREQFIVEQMRLKNISSEIIISPHKVETYYLAHKEEFKLEDEVKLRMIFLNRNVDAATPDPGKLAEEILTKLKEGADFADMAKTYSQGSQRNQGGDWGWVERKVLATDLAQAAFALKKGERSSIIERSDGYYIMLVEDKRETHFKSLGEVRDQIEKNLVLDERKRLETQWIERLKKKTFTRTL